MRGCIYSGRLVKGISLPVQGYPLPRRRALYRVGKAGGRRHNPLPPCDCHDAQRKQMIQVKRAKSRSSKKNQGRAPSLSSLSIITPSHRLILFTYQPQILLSFSMLGHGSDGFRPFGAPSRSLARALGSVNIFPTKSLACILGGLWVKAVFSGSSNAAPSSRHIFESSLLPKYLVSVFRN